MFDRDTSAECKKYREDHADDGDLPKWDLCYPEKQERARKIEENRSARAEKKKAKKDEKRVLRQGRTVKTVEQDGKKVPSITLLTGELAHVMDRLERSFGGEALDLSDVLRTVDLEADPKFKADKMSPNDLYYALMSYYRAEYARKNAAPGPTLSGGFYELVGGATLAPPPALWKIVFAHKNDKNFHKKAFGIGYYGLEDPAPEPHFSKHRAAFASEMERRVWKVLRRSGQP